MRAHTACISICLNSACCACVYVVVCCICSFLFRIKCYWWRLDAQENAKHSTLKVFISAIDNLISFQCSIDGHFSETLGPMLLQFMLKCSFRFIDVSFTWTQFNSIQSNCVTTKYYKDYFSTYIHIPTHPYTLSRPNAQHTQFNLILTLVLHPAKAIHLNTCSKLFFSVSKIREIETIENKQASQMRLFIYSITTMIFKSNFRTHQVVCKSARDTEGALVAKNIVLLFSC